MEVLTTLGNTNPIESSVEAHSCHVAPRYPCRPSGRGQNQRLLSDDQIAATDLHPLFVGLCRSFSRYEREHNIEGQQYQPKKGRYQRIFCPLDSNLKLDQLSGRTLVRVHADP